MNWMALLAVVLKIIECLKHCETEHEFVAQCSEVQGYGDMPFSADGKLLRWIWENRDQILNFVLQIVDLFSEEEQS